MTTKPETRDGDLPGALTALDRAISTLTHPKPHHRQLDNGTTRINWAPALYQQLDDAVTAAAQDGDYHGTPRSKPPLWVEATDLKHEIDRTTRKWAAPDQPDTPSRLATITETHWRPQDTPKLAAWTQQIHSWTRRIQELLAPETRKHLDHDCPACGKRHVHRWIDGERIQQPALKISPERCWCLNCKAQWDFPQYLAHLCRLLGYELPPGVLE